jgi:putative RNA 2'-phosphotransferase
LPAKIPPGILYHGTAKRFLDQILKQGLQKQARRHVHLSADMQTALSVGARYGKVVILEVDTKTMRENNLVFYQAKNGVWLTDYVPEKYLTIIEV